MTVDQGVGSILSGKQRKLLGIANRARDEMIVDLVECRHCGAPRGKYCRGVNKPETRSLHVTRKDDAFVVKRADPEGWTRLHDETFRRLVAGV